MSLSTLAPTLDTQESLSDNKKAKNKLEWRRCGVDDFTPEEAAFFSALDAALKAAHKNTFYKATRMANGAISVQNQHAYIGKIKLRGRKTWMQYMTGLYNAETAEDEPLEEYIRLLRFWVKTA